MSKNIWHVEMKTGIWIRMESFTSRDGARKSVKMFKYVCMKYGFKTLKFRIVKEPLC